MDCTELKFGEYHVIGFKRTFDVSPLLNMLHCANILLIKVTLVVLEIETVWLKLEHPKNILVTTSKLEDVVNVSGWVPSFEVLPLLNMLHISNIPLILLTRVILEIETVWLKLEHSKNILFKCTGSLLDVVNVSGWFPSFEVLPLLNMIQLSNIPLIKVTRVILEIETVWLKL